MTPQKQCGKNQPPFGVADPTDISPSGEHSAFWRVFRYNKKRLFSHEG